MIFISFSKWKQAPTKEMRPRMDQFTKTLEELEKQGIKMRVYWTLGRYNAVSITEAPTAEDVMKIFLPFGDLVDIETMVAIPREKAIKLL